MENKDMLDFDFSIDNFFEEVNNQNQAEPKKPKKSAKEKASKEEVAKIEKAAEEIIREVKSSKAKITKAKTVKEKKKEESSLKEEVMDVNKRIKELEKELTLKDKRIKELTSSAAIVVDVQNEDNLKNIYTLMDEGKVIIGNNNRPFILAKQTVKPYNCINPPVHKICIDEIEFITIRRYYLDLTTCEIGNRTMVKEVIWCKHHKDLTHSVISRENLDYLIDNNFISIKKISYAFVDLETYDCFNYNHDTEPTLKEIAVMIKAREQKWEKQNKYSSTDTVEGDKAI